MSELEPTTVKIDDEVDADKVLEDLEAVEALKQAQESI